MRATVLDSLSWTGIMRGNGYFFFLGSLCILFVSACGTKSATTTTTTSSTFQALAQTVTPSEVQIQWTAPQDQSVAGYRVYRDGVAIGDVLPPSQTGYFDHNLEPGRSYSYFVMAIAYPMGAVASSNLVSATMPSVSPGWALSTVDHGDAGAPHSWLAVDGTGTAYAVYTNPGVCLATNTGPSWDCVSLVPSGTDPEIAVDGADSVHVGYEDTTDNSLWEMTDSSGTWATSPLDSSTVLPMPMGMSHAGGGVMLAQFLDSQHMTHYLLRSQDTLVYKSEMGGMWSIDPIAVSPGGPAALTVDVTGAVDVAYYNGLYLMHATDRYGAWQTDVVTRLDAAGGDLSIALDLAGGVHIAYMDQNADLCEATDASGTWKIDYVDCAGTVGAQNTIQVDSVNRVWIGYVDVTKGAVRVARGD